MKNKFIKSLIFICTGLGFTTLTWAGINAAITPPSQVGRPNIPYIDETECKIQYHHPKKDGGEPVKKYYCAYRYQQDLAWKYRGASTTTTYHFKNMRRGALAQFRVSASNSAGMGQASYATNAIIFCSPYAER